MLNYFYKRRVHNQKRMSTMNIIQQQLISSEIHIIENVSKTRFKSGGVFFQKKKPTRPLSKKKIHHQIQH